MTLVQSNFYSLHQVTETSNKCNKLYISICLKLSPNPIPLWAPSTNPGISAKDISFCL